MNERREEKVNQGDIWKKRQAGSLLEMYFRSLSCKYPDFTRSCSQEPVAVTGMAGEEGAS